MSTNFTTRAEVRKYTTGQRTCFGNFYETLCHFGRTIDDMKRNFFLPICGVLLCSPLFGCGGGLLAALRTASVSGNVIDLAGNTVQNVEITMDGQSTISNTGGAFVLTGLREGVWELRAESTPTGGGATYSAFTVVQVFEGERSRSINVTLVRSDQQATFRGFVRDRFGNIIQGAHVFAFLQSGGTQLSSIHDVSNSNGAYELKGLAAGFTYTVNGSAREFASDRSSVSLSAGEVRQYDIIVGDTADPMISPPGNMSAVAWTTPNEITRSQSDYAAFENLKRISDPRRLNRRGTTRETSSGNNIEVDLVWDTPTSNLNFFLGYGIYMATTSNGISNPVDFLRDPETYFYADLSDYLIENQNYYYEMTSLNVNYPNTFNSESNFGDRYGVRTLDDLVLAGEIQGPLEFFWQGGSGATEYFVYLFDELPSIGTDSIWVNSISVSGTSLVYSGPSLTSGHRYYYMVLGMANGGDSRTISRLGDFVAN